MIALVVGVAALAVVALVLRERRRLGLRADAAERATDERRARLATARGGGGHAPRAVEGRLVEVGALVDGLLEAWMPFAQLHGRALRRPGARLPVWVRGDAGRLGTALGNLIANAFEHGGGPIELSVRASGGCVRIEVRDDGPGLRRPLPVLAGGPAKDLTRRRGLAVAAEIARHHGGWLGAAPTDRGARVALELPAALTAVAPLAVPRR